MKFKDSEIGSVYCFDKIVDKKLVMEFAEVSGDLNNLYVDGGYAKKEKVKNHLS